MARSVEVLGRRGIRWTESPLLLKAILLSADKAAVPKVELVCSNCGCKTSLNGSSRPDRQDEGLCRKCYDLAAESAINTHRIQLSGTEKPD